MRSCATHSGCLRCTSASWIFSRTHQGEGRARIPAEFRARVFKPLGVSDALREGLKTFNKAWRNPVRGPRMACRRAIHGSCAGGLTNHCLLHSKECERDRTNSPGLSLRVRPGGRQKSGAATSGVHSLRAGRRCDLLCSNPAQRPRHKNHVTWTRQQTVDHALHHILCRHT